MNRTRRSRVMRMALVAGLLTVLTACGVRAQSEPELVPLDRVPQVGQHSTSAPATGLDRVWGARDARLVPVYVDLPRPGLASRLRALLTLADPDQTPPTTIPAGTQLDRVERRGSTVVLTFSSDLLRTAKRDLPLALGQLVLTATEEPGVVAVSVRAADRPVLLVSGEGTSVPRPLQRTDFLAFRD